VITVFSTWRDSAGRVRTEWPPHGIAPGGVEIKDPTAGYTYNLDFVNHVAYRTPLGAEASAPATPASSADATVSSVSLGTQVVSGVPATGVRTTTVRQNAKPAMAEVWTARNEGVVLLEKVSAANGDETTISLKNFSTKEPDPSLFAVPATYQILDEYGNQIQAKK